MAEYCGLNLAGSRWDLIRAESRGDSLDALGKSVRISLPQDSTLSTGVARVGLAGLFEGALQLNDRTLERSPGTVIDRVKVRVAKTKWKQAVLASINVGNPPRAIGVCHPYGASPLVRRAIPELLDGRPIGIHPRDGYQVKRADVTYPILTIEAPLAGCFELIATGNLKLPARVVLLFSTASLAFELAIVRVSAQRDVLNLDVRQVRNFSDPPDTKAVSQLLSGCIPINTPAETCYLYRIGENPTLREIERTLRQDFSALQFVEEPKEEALAAGAARFAAWWNESKFHGTPYSALEVQHICPFPTGVVCTNQRGVCFWHKLFEAGQRLPATVTLRPAGGSKATQLVMAEAHAWSQTPDWVSHAGWDACGLRWFDTIQVADAGDLTKELVTTLDTTSGKLNENWSCPVLGAAFADKSS
jgi:hypothetical protein